MNSFLYDGQSGHAVFRLEGSSVESCRRIGFDLPASGDNNVFAGQVAFSPFNGAGLDVSSVLARGRARCACKENGHS